MNNTNEQIEKLDIDFVDGIYIKITGTIETLTDVAGADRFIMSQELYDALKLLNANALDKEASEDEVKQRMIELGGISQVRFISFIYDNKWYAVTAEFAKNHGIIEDTFYYPCFGLGRYYSKADMDNVDIMTAYDFEKHEDIINNPEKYKEELEPSLF